MITKKLRIPELYEPDYRLYKLFYHCFLLMKNFLDYEADRSDASVSCSDLKRSPIHKRLTLLCYIILKYAKNCDKRTAAEFISFLAENQDTIIPADIVFFNILGQTIASRLLEDKDTVFKVFEQLSESKKSYYSDCVDHVISLISECRWSIERRIEQIHNVESGGWKTILDTGKMFVSFLDYLLSVNPRTNEEVINFSKDFFDDFRKHVSDDTIFIFIVFGVAYQIIHIIEKK